MSGGPFESLNCSFSVGDAAADVTQNLALLAAAAGVAPAALHTVTQVHGDRVVWAGEAGAGVEADGLWTAQPGTAVGVRTADCLPILIEDPRGPVTAVHAGWRGVIAEIAARAVEALVRGGAPVETLRVGLGPCIQRCCFEVDGELPARFAAAFGEAVVVAQPGKARVHLDLPLAVQLTLSRLGVPASHVSALPHCTHCDARFFSHRRERGLTGRHLSFIRCAGAASL